MQGVLSFSKVSEMWRGMNSTHSIQSQKEEHTSDDRRCKSLSAKN